MGIIAIAGHQAIARFTKDDGAWLRVGTIEERAGEQASVCGDLGRDVIVVFGEIEWRGITILDARLELQLLQQEERGVLVGRAGGGRWSG